MEWADALIWRTVLGSPAAQADVAMKDLLYHTHVTQHAFVQVWRGRVVELPAAATFDVATLGQWAQAFYAETTTDASWQGGGALRRQVPDSLVEKARARLGPEATLPTIADTVLQVVLHSTYHRGQVSRRLRELGCEPPLTEYFVWVWRGKPAADWQVGSAGSAPN
jgi:uncharacterized damage-inducible protein DinB